MNIFGKIVALLASLVAVSACSGNVDDASLPVLSVSAEQIDIASGENAAFTVTYDGADVTAESVIYIHPSAEKLQSSVYSPDKVGSFTFYAEYAGKTSNEVVVEVVDSTPQVIESKFNRNVCVFEFTGAWCINCPEGYDKMMGVLSKPSMAKYKENIHICAFHSNVEGTDTLAISATQDVFRLFEGLAYPSFTTDMRESGVLTSEGIAVFQPSLVASFEEYTPYCGVAVSSSVEGSSAKVTVKLTAEKTSEYRAIILVVQDKIRGWQKTPTFSEGQDDYNHRHVVRKVVSSYSGTFTGEKFTDDGVVAAGTEVSKTWSFDIDSKWVLENTEIYAIVLGSDGYVNNMNICNIDGGNSGYNLK